MVPTFLAIGIGMWLGTIMWFNVWFVIWPNQQKALNIGGKYPDLAARRQGRRRPRPPAMFSRINTLLSIPMLFCMVGGGASVLSQRDLRMRNRPEQSGRFFCLRRWTTHLA